MFLKDIERKKIHNTLLTASEVSYSYRNKVILMMDDKEDTLKKADEEYSEDPHYSLKANITCLDSQSCPLVINSGTLIKIIGSSSEDGDTFSGHSGSSLASLMSKPTLQKAALFSINGNTSSTFRINFMRVFKSCDINVVLETTIQNHHVYQIMDEADMVATYKAPKRPVDHSTQYDNQAILVMEDDPVVRKAATYLYDKHPTVTSVYMLENEKPKLIKGDAVPVSEDSRLVLVGHGKRDSGGNMRLGGYKAEEVAEIIKYMNIERNLIKTTSIVACEVGSDEALYSTLLKELNARSIDIELHLRNSHHFTLEPTEAQSVYDMKLPGWSIQPPGKKDFRWEPSESEGISGQSDDHMMITILNEIQGCQNFAECLVQRTQAINMFLKDIEGKKIHNTLLTASEVSYSYRNKVILMMDDKEDTLKKADEEYSEDPHYSLKANMTCLDSQSCPLVINSGTLIKIIGSSSEDGDTFSGHSGSSLASLMSKPALQKAALFSINGNTSSTFRINFMRVFKSRDINVVLETTIQNHHLYQIMDEKNIVTTYKAPKRPVDHSTQYDNQAILVMEDDPVVRKAATYLYDKHPTVTSVYMLENGKPKLIKGDAVPVSEDSRLVLVGHGKRDSGGNMRLGGYKAEEVAEIIKYMNIEGNLIKTTSIVACEVGSDKAFYSTLLKELNARSIDTELHLRNSLVQVSITGQKITAELTPERISWRHNDDSKKIVVKLDSHGEVVTQTQSGRTGEEFFSDELNYLGPKPWPTQPERFVHTDIRRAHTDDLEALAWAFFQHRQDNPSKSLKGPQVSNNDNNLSKYAIYDLQLQYDQNLQKYRREETRWYLSDENSEFIDQELNKCYELKSGEDMLNVIAHYARFGEDYPKYLMLNDWIFKIYPKKLYVFPVGKRLNNNENVDQIKGIIEEQFDKHKYPDIRNGIEKHAGNNRDSMYAQYARKTLQGNYEKATMKKLHAEAWFSTYFLASLISESMRNFRSFPITLMAIDISTNPETSEHLLNELPMTGGATWIDTVNRGYHGSSTKVRGKQKYLKELIENEEKIFELWLSKHGKTETDVGMLRNLLSLVYSEDQLNTKLESFQESYNNFKNALPQSQPTSGALGGSHDGPITLQDMHLATDVESSLKLSSYYSRSTAILAGHIQNELKRTFGGNTEEFHVKPGSYMIKDGEFHCQLVSEKNPHDIKEWKVQLPEESQFQLEKIHKNIQRVPDPTTTHTTLEHAGMALGTVGLLLGAQGAVQAFEHGDKVKGTVATLQLAHGITGMSLAALGKQVSVGESKVMKVISTTFKNPATKRALAVFPVIGIGFGVYNIVEDIKRGDALGYTDAVFDSFILGMDVVEAAQPELIPIIEPINLALSAVRMIFDDVFVDVQDELKNLPANAGILNKIGAFFKGVGEGVDHFIMDVDSFFFTIPYREIENGHRLVEQISDYHKYYSMTEVQSGRKAIDFTGGESSWNGGSITFCLTDNGPSEFCMDNFVSADETIGRNCWNIDTDRTDDIVLGTGESNLLSYSNIQRKVLLFIPAGSVQVVSGYQALDHSRYGKYTGNNRNNNFFAVQKNMDNHTMEVMLSYYYKLYGKAADDTFYLGPQRSYIEGQEGRDMYIVPKDGSNTIINNYDPLKTTDVLILSNKFSEISVRKDENDVVLQYHDDHHVRIKYWFTGDVYRHMNIISEDGVLFDISTSVIHSVNLIARGINLMSKSEGQKVNTTESHLLSVTSIMGSPHNDILIGNAQKNLIDGGGGCDYIKGGEGEDVYVVNEREISKVQIENYSKDKEMDMIMIEANLHDFKTRVEENNLILIPFSDYKSDVTLINWFRSEEDRHLLVVTKDLITFSLSVNKSLCHQPDPLHSKCILSQNIDYSTSIYPLAVDLETDEAYQNVTDIRGSDLDDKIMGNAQGNNIIPGKGNDFLRGCGGQDLYIVTPDYGFKFIDNSSPDLALDTLFLKVNYDLITVRCLGTGSILFINEHVILVKWFSSNYSQHLQVRTADGITFSLISDPSQCGDQLKLPQSVDYRNEKSGKDMLMNTSEFVSVVEMYGSSGFDTMIGNSKDNLLDPFQGGGYMIGGEGKDTYIVKPQYGTQVIINNFANDRKEDMVRFQTEFLHNPITVEVENNDVIISANEKGQNMKIRLQDYKASPKHQHLNFQAIDGVYFRLSSPITTQSEALQNPSIEAYKVQLQDEQLDCLIDLSSQKNLSTVHTVQGCSYQSNHILGNDLDNALFGGIKDDIIDGGNGHDTLTGGQGNDILLGSAGNDTMYGEDGDDTMLGGPGFDVFIPGQGKDVIDGGSGRDTVIYQGDHEKGKGVYINLLSGEGHHADAAGDVLKDVENVIGTIYSDILVSGYEPALLKGSDGDDFLVSLAEGDYLVGGEGRDIYVMVPHHGSITVDNCAEDYATDILYLPTMTTPSVVCMNSTLGLKLKFQIDDNTFVFVLLKDWLIDNHRCGHLTVIMGEYILSDEVFNPKLCSKVD